MRVLEGAVVPMFAVVAVVVVVVDIPAGTVAAAVVDKVEVYCYHPLHRIESSRSAVRSLSPPLLQMLSLLHPLFSSCR